MTEERKIQERVKAAIAAADAARREGRFQEALERLGAVMGISTADDEVCFRMGNVYYDQGDFRQAAVLYERAVSFNPNHVSATHNLAVVYKRLGHIDESVMWHKQARRLQRPWRRRGGSRNGEPWKSNRRGSATAEVAVVEPVPERVVQPVAAGLAEVSDGLQKDDGADRNDDSRSRAVIIAGLALTAGLLLAGGTILFFMAQRLAP